MKTKREIVKWLESQCAEAVSRVTTERTAAIDAYTKEREKKIRLDDTAEAIFVKLQEATAICEKWIVETEKITNMKRTNGYYGNMLRSLNMDKQGIRNALMRHFSDSTPERRAIVNNAEAAIQKIKTNYGNVIANVNSAKNNKVAVEYLRSLGFDTSFLEEATVVTELTVPVDTQWLLLGKKDEA